MMAPSRRLVACVSLLVIAILLIFVAPQRFVNILLESMR